MKREREPSPAPSSASSDTESEHAAEKLSDVDDDGETAADYGALLNRRVELPPKGYFFSPANRPIVEQILQNMEEALGAAPVHNAYLNLLI